MERRIIDVDERLPLLQTLPLSLQHLFAMFGATVLVPFLFKVSPATSLLMNGIGTLVYLVGLPREGPGLPRVELRLPLAGLRGPRAPGAGRLRRGAGGLHRVRPLLHPRLAGRPRGRHAVARRRLPARRDGGDRRGHRPRARPGGHEHGRAHRRRGDPAGPRHGRRRGDGDARRHDPRVGPLPGLPRRHPRPRRRRRRLRRGARRRDRRPLGRRERPPGSRRRSSTRRRSRRRRS